MAKWGGVAPVAGAESGKPPCKHQHVSLPLGPQDSKTESLLLFPISDGGFVAPSPKRRTSKISSRDE